MPFSPERHVFEYTPGRINPLAKSRPLAGIDLNFDGEPTQHLTHALHPYVAAINPPLARRLIDTYVPAKGTVLDPFCGGGGILIESLLSGRNCAGFDVNPLAIMIAKAKTTYIERERIKAQCDDICKRAEELLTVAVPPNISEAARYWFRPETLPELAALSSAVNEIKEEDLKTLFSVILSITVRSVMLTYRGEVRLRKLRDEDLQNAQPKVMAVFVERCRVALQEVPNLPTHARARVELADARQLPLEDGEYHSIICSPPYADDTNGVGYFQFSRYMLEWLGMSPDTINRYKRQFLGSNLSIKTVPPSMTFYIAAANVKARNQQHYKEAVAFYADYYQALSEMKRVVTDWIIIVIGNRVLSRTLFDNANITLELFKHIGGVKFVDYYSRTIRKKRLPNLGGDGGGISVEHVLVFKKSR
ncbi:MAG: DNA methyltransferase [Chloroflexota bacterium]